VNNHDPERDKAVNNIKAGKAASVWMDRETGRLLILSSPVDLPTFERRQREGAFVMGAEFVCEVSDAGMVREVQAFNAGLEISF
jgi:hypothetical protein